MNAPDLITQMADIKGMGGVSIWPLAFGWWLLLACLGVCLAVAAFFYHRRVVFENSWKGDAKRSLEQLENECASRDGKSLASDLSSLLRRIAMQRYSRKACAGLEGQEWLRFLKLHDPKGFDWMREGRVLTKIPYAPEASYPLDKIKTLITAARSWVS